MNLNTNTERGGNLATLSVLKNIKSTKHNYYFTKLIDQLQNNTDTQ